MNLQDAETMAQSLMLAHLKDWCFEFDSAVIRFGSCLHSKKLITLSRSLTELNNSTLVENTILHEIAHALVGRGHGHSNAWRRTAVRIGCDGKRCYSATANVTTPKYQGTCPNCHNVILCYRRRNISCVRCSKTWNPRYKFSYKKVKGESEQL